MKVYTLILLCIAFGACVGIATHKPLIGTASAIGLYVLTFAVYRTK